MIYLTLAQSTLTYCITVWGGASKTKIIESQRALLKVIYLKKRTFPTRELYETSGILTIRQLYIFHIIQNTHKHCHFIASQTHRKRKNRIMNIPICKTVFARQRYLFQSAYLYNKINKTYFIYPMTLSECKKVLTSWLKTLGYEETEQFLTIIT